MKNLLFEVGDAEESIFNPDLLYVKDWTRQTVDKLFYGNLQQSNGGNNQNRSAFYSMKLMPKKNGIFPLFDTGVSLVLNPGKDLEATIPMTFNEYVTYDDPNWLGEGNFFFDNNLALDFDKNVLKSKMPGRFLIKMIEYDIKANDGKTLTVRCGGKFESEFKIGKNVSSASVMAVEIRFTSKDITVSLIENNKILYTYSRKR